MPTPRRAEFIITNIACRPLCGSPTSQPWAPSKFITQVELPWMPILCSSEAQRSALRSPIAPSWPTLNFGVTNSEMPFGPGGASGNLASTRWTMFSARSCSPAVMKILVPVMA